MKGIHELFDIHHKLIGVFVEPEVWALIKKDVEMVLKRHGLMGTNKEVIEPMEDWELFKKCWDFKYPFDFSVKCKVCGNETKNWETDVQKKFLLTAASVSGLVSFRCLNCGSKIVKKHFKDKIVTECIPKKD
ncbi:hypothetical protein JCM13304A_00970 [Desulfothermus okinawensis JCM 13304]